MSKLYGNEITGDALTSEGHYNVLLTSAGNPDHGQDPYQPMYGVRDALLRVKSLAEASSACAEFIKDNGLGGGNWTGGDVRVEGSMNVVARISYNGRVWAVPEVAK